MKIVNRCTTEIIFEDNSLTIAATVRAAIAKNADLRYADLRYADLSSADLRYADLRSADLRSADLSSADLRYANLRYANLRYANLRYANLSSANLSSANLSSANLRYANLRYANLPSPSIVMLAYWGVLSPALTADLMMYDASFHPDQTAFDRWAKGGPCPYADAHVQRACNFIEYKALWGKGKFRKPYSLMLRLFKEKEIKF